MKILLMRIKNIFFPRYCPKCDTKMELLHYKYPIANNDIMYRCPNCKSWLSTK